MYIMRKFQFAPFVPLWYITEDAAKQEAKVIWVPVLWMIVTTSMNISN
jgi:hypothetical protein